jgi:hypothetical protein
MILPVPVPHIDRPMIRGTILMEGRPVVGAVVQISADVDRVPVGCGDSQEELTTSRFGEFEFAVDRSSWTVFWSAASAGLAICLPSIVQGPLWTGLIKKIELPPFLPETIDITCNIGGIDSEVCVTSLRDTTMPDCDLDLDYQHPYGWLDVKTSEPYSGRCVAFNDNGTISERSDFINGKRIGPWNWFFDSGTRELQYFSIDGRNRRTTTWYENGQMSQQMHYRSTSNEKGFPVLHGLNTAWHENGKIEIQSCWKDGLKVEIAPEKCVFNRAK